MHFLSSLLALVMFLPLVTAMNNDGHSTLKPSHGDGPLRLRDVFDKSHRNQLLVLNAVSTLLVRNSEVVAVTSLTSQSNKASFSILSLQDDQSRGEDDTVDPDNLTNEQIEELRDTVDTGFTTFTNASPKDRYFSPDDATTVRTAPGGMSYWEECDKLDTYLRILRQIKIPRNDRLENHIATITQFMNVYRQADVSSHGYLFWKFSSYVVLSCWQKMFRRVTNWTFKGFIHSIAILPPQQLKASCERYRKRVPTSSRSDDSLYQEISSIEDKNLERIMLKLHCYPRLTVSGDPLNISKLMAALRVANDGKGKGHNREVPVYNQDTCIEFHYFLLALFLGYGNALTKYHRAYKAKVQASQDAQHLAGKKEKKKKKKERKDTNAKAGTETEAEAGGIRVQEATEVGDEPDAVFNFTRMLWRVTSSQMFSDHVEVLQLAGLTAPSESYAKLYATEVIFDDLNVVNRRVGHEHEEEESEEGKSDMGGEKEDNGEEEQSSDGGGQDDLDDLDLNAGGEEEDVEEELRRRTTLVDSAIAGVVADNSPGNLFKHWARLNTSHLTALRILTLGARNRAEPITTRLIVANHRGGHSQPHMDWHETIYNLCPETSLREGARFPATSRLDTNANDPINLDPQPPSGGDSPSPATFGHAEAQESIQLIQRYIDDGDPDVFKLLISFGISGDATSTAQSGARRPLAGKVAWIGNPHCETVAAALSIYTDAAIDTEDPLHNLISTSDKTSLAVSKLCCPVCWELLQVMRGDTLDFKVRGYHTSLYPVELPSWLPKEVLKEMVHRFRGHLRRELTSLLKRPQQAKTHKRSESHSSTLSAGSAGSVPAIGDDIARWD